MESCRSTWSSRNGDHDNSPGSSGRNVPSRLTDMSKSANSDLRPSIDASAIQSMLKLSIHDGSRDESPEALEKELRERARCLMVTRKKDFNHVERIKGREVNILQGLELHTNVFNADEQKKVVDYVYNLQHMGQQGKLRARTYTEPSKWMRGKGRVTIQFGCCYNYAVDKNGNPPGIIRDEEVDPIPPLFKEVIKRLVRWRVLPSNCVPNSCIVNLYDEGDCIPPHIDHHDFLRPFCTISFLAECNILFGASLKVVDAGEFSGPVSIPLPVGSVLILKGNGADVAKHCVPAVPAQRISITFRKMDESKLPYGFKPDPDLQGLQPLPLSSSSLQVGHAELHSKTRSQHSNGKREDNVNISEAVNNSETPQFWKSKVQQNKVVEIEKVTESPFSPELDEFPPLGSGSSTMKTKHKTRWN